MIRGKSTFTMFREGKGIDGSGSEVWVRIAPLAIGRVSS